MRFVQIPVAALLLLSAGCIGLNKPTPPLRYVIDPKPQIAPAENAGKTLAVRPLEPARPYKQNVVYREGAEMGIYTLIEWSELPSDAATRALIDALNTSGRFKDTAKAIDLGVPDFILTGQLRKFDLVRDAEPWTAVCEIRLELREGTGRELVWAKTLTASEPLATSESSALPPAMNSALSHIIEGAVTEIVTK
ncbi:MAG: membrane integrity-associated transporter subunit PqiC [Candidatus Hydrogenedentes bacterium]|nr:membrane integrity-associated transporter subunit PqiC [Candidatus Hydrogenedentota bacterium]